MKSYKILGINLKQHYLSNCDKIITIFSREEGKLKAVAKSCLKPNCKIGARIEPMQCVYYVLSRGKNLDIISQLETKESFKNIRKSLICLKSSMYFLWIIDKATEERQANPALFDLLFVSLKALDKTLADPEKVRKTKQFFQKEFLKCEGLFDAKLFSEQEFENKFFDYTF